MPRLRGTQGRHGRNALSATFALLALLQAPPAGPPAREVRVVMGTAAEVWAGGLAQPAPALEAAFAALDEVDRSMSLWKPDSELSLLNRRGQALASPGLFAVIAHALDVARASGGAFDPTVEPLVRARGGVGGPAHEPGPRERKKLLARVGYERVKLDPASRAVRLAPGTSLDLGGIAKGYAADLAVAALRRAGATSGMVDLGQSSVCVFGDALTLEVADPEAEGRRTWAAFEIRDACVGASGTSQRGEHILDPRTGLAALGVLGATVVAASGIEADALSTAAFVLGPEPGLALVERRGAAGFVLLRERGRAVIQGTPGFAESSRLETRPAVGVR